MILARVCVCTPSRRAKRGSSLYCGGWEQNSNQSVKGTPAEKTCAGHPAVPGDPAWKEECISRWCHRASSPGSRRSPEWWAFCATERKFRQEVWTFTLVRTDTCVELVHSCRKKAESEELSNSSHQMFWKWCHTSTKWLSGPYSSLSSSITRLLKKDENFFFCLPGWEIKEVWRERGRGSDKRRGTILLVLFCYVCVAALFSSDLISGGGVSTKLQTAKKEK